MEYRECVALQFWQAIRVWPHSEIFAGRRPAKMLVGELPKPAGLRDKLSQSPGAMRLLSAACRYRSWALFSRPSVTPSRWSIFALTATAMLYRKAGLLHEPQKRRKIGGLFLQSRHNGQPHPLFCRGRLFPLVSSSCRQFSFTFFTILSGFPTLLLLNIYLVLNKCYKSSKSVDE